MTTSRIHEFFRSAPARGRTGLHSAWKICAALLLCAGTAMAAPARPFTLLYSFTGGSDGGSPSGLVQGYDGNFYGTTGEGGAYSGCTGYANACGTIFKITPAGAETVLHSFCQTDCADGYGPSGLLQASDGSLYGTTYAVGPSGYGSGPDGPGTVFKITPAGTFTTLYTFGGTDGSGPYAGLIQGTDGNFYGTTAAGGTGTGCTLGCGTVFRITPGGALTTLHNFNGTDGAAPYAGLVQAADGNFYGTTQSGGASSNCSGGCGTVFKITPSGMLTTLYSFCAQTDCPDGYGPVAGLVQATDGNLYGTTPYGGDWSLCRYISWGNGCGTVFKITPSGALTTLHSFDNTDGYRPLAGVVQATDGNLYGTTQLGGSFVYGGTLFKITPGGTLTMLHDFCIPDCEINGYQPSAGLVQATNGSLYGTTGTLGPGGWGTAFELSVGLRPFVEAVPTEGTVGTSVTVLGNNLTGTTDVRFNGTVATFTVVSSSEITTTVPLGATTGPVTVTTPSGTLSSNVPFRVAGVVEPRILSFSPESGPVGASVVITGTDFTGANEVRFGCNYTPASFTVDSDTQITAIVPASAVSGRIGVRTPDGDAISGTGFVVTP